MGKKLDIRQQLMIKYTTLAIVFGIIFLVLGITIGKQVIIDNSEILLSNFAKEVGENIGDIIQLEIKNAEIIADVPMIHDPQVSIEEKLEYLRSVVVRQGYKKAALIDLKGNCVTINDEKVNVADLEYFNKSIQGESFLSTPYYSKADGGLQIAITAPIMEEGQVTSILFLSKEAEKFSEITNGILFGRTGTAYVIDEEGTNIINRDISKVINKVNRIEDAKIDSSYEELAQITERMIAGQNGTGSYMFHGKRKFLGYAPIPNKGWAIGITVELSDMLSGVKKLERNMMLFSVIMTLCMIIVTQRVAKDFSSRLMKIQGEVSQMAKGDFTLNKKRYRIMDEISKIDDELQMTKLSVIEMVNRLQSSSEKVRGQYNRLHEASQKTSKKTDKNDQ